MSIESKIDQLIAALEANTAALTGGKTTKAPAKLAAVAVAKTTPAKKDEVTAESVKAKITETVKALGVDVAKKLLDETQSGAKKFPDLEPANYATFITKADMALAEAAQS